MLAALSSPACPAPAEVSAESVTLTPRQQQILLYFMRGYNTPQTAAALRVTRHTIKQHAKLLYRKIAVANRMAAVLWALARPDLCAAAETIPLVNSNLCEAASAPQVR